MALPLEQHGASSARPPPPAAVGFFVDYWPLAQNVGLRVLCDSSAVVEPVSWVWACVVCYSGTAAG